MSLHQEERIDRRVARTRRLLRDALLALVQENGWDAITVQDVCDRADVGRSTFYIHFGDKEDLLLSGFEDLRGALRAQVRAQPPDRRRPLAFSLAMIEHARDSRQLFRALIGKNSGRAAEKHFLRLVMELIREDLGLTGAGEGQKEAAVRYLAGGFLELVRWWLDSRNPLPPGDLDELFHRLAEPALAAASQLPGPRRPR